MFDKLEFVGLLFVGGLDVSGDFDRDVGERLDFLAGGFFVVVVFFGSGCGSLPVPPWPSAGGIAGKTSIKTTSTPIPVLWFLIINFRIS